MPELFHPALLRQWLFQPNARPVRSILIDDDDASRLNSFPFKVTAFSGGGRHNGHLIFRNKIGFVSQNVVRRVAQCALTPPLKPSEISPYTQYIPIRDPEIYSRIGFRSRTPGPFPPSCSINTIPAASNARWIRPIVWAVPAAIGDCDQGVALAASTFLCAIGLRDRARADRLLDFWSYDSRRHLQFISRL